MITYESHTGYGNPAEALAEAEALALSLRDAMNVRDLFREFPGALDALCSPRGDRVLLDVYEHEGRLRITAREALPGEEGAADDRIA